MKHEYFLDGFKHLWDSQSYGSAETNLQPDIEKTSRVGIRPNVDTGVVGSGSTSGRHI